MPSDLTTNLIADWELIANANDSHTGALHLTEVGGAPTYGASGVTLGSPKYLRRAAGGVLSFGTGQSWMIAYEITKAASQNGCCLSMGEDVSVEMYGGWAVAQQTVTFSEGSSSQANTSNLANGLHHIIIYHNLATQKLGIIADNGAAVEDAAAHSVAHDPLAPFLIGASYNTSPGDFLANTQIRRVRVWQGASSIKSAADIEWLYNAGTGRTYAEILATAVTRTGQDLAMLGVG